MFKSTVTIPGVLFGATLIVLIFAIVQVAKIARNNRPEKLIPLLEQVTIHKEPEPVQYQIKFFPLPKYKKDSTEVVTVLLDPGWKIVGTTANMLILTYPLYGEEYDRPEVQ